MQPTGREKEQRHGMGMPCAFIVSVMPHGSAVITIYTRYCSLCFLGFGGKAFLFCFLEMINSFAELMVFVRVKVAL